MVKITKYEKYNEIVEDICLGKGSNRQIGERYGKPAGYVNSIRKKIDAMKYPPRILDDRLVCYRCGCPNLDWHMHHSHKTGKWICIACRDCNYELESNIVYIPKQYKIMLNADEYEAWHQLMKEFNEKDMKKFVTKFPKYYYERESIEAHK